MASRHLFILQDRHEIFLMRAKYSEEYVKYLHSKGKELAVVECRNMVHFLYPTSNTCDGLHVAVYLEIINTIIRLMVSASTLYCWKT